MIKNTAKASVQIWFRVRIPLKKFQVHVRQKLQILRFPVQKSAEVLVLCARTPRFVLPGSKEATQEAQDNILTSERQGEASVSERMLPLDVRDFEDVNKNQQCREPAAQSFIFQQEVALYP